MYVCNSDESLRRGAFRAAASVLPVVVVMGFLGTVAAGQGGVGDPTIAFFYVIDESNFLVAPVLIVLVVSLVCSSAYTLQNAIVASFSRAISDGVLSLKSCRVSTIAMIPMAIYLASGPTIIGLEFNALLVIRL